MVKFDKVTKKFGEIVALEGASFEIKPGEFVFITGPSGAGKTTIVKLILREYLPTTGKIEEEEINKEIPKILKLVGLEERAHLFPSQLAGGELQRAGLARAVIGQPDIVIADEPTGNLDLATAWQIIKLLQKVNKMGKTVIMATHNFEIVNSMKERVIELDKGKLVSDKKKGKYKVR